MEVNDFTKQLEQVDWHEETDRRHPATLIPALETISNSFSFRPKELVEAVNANPSAAYNFAILSCACTISMAYTYLCDEKRGGHWDARNLASQRYFYEHFDALKEAFDKLAGFPMPFKEEPRFQYFQDDCRLPRKERLYQELCAFDCVHHTLQQSLAGAFVIAIATAVPESGMQADQGFPYPCVPLQGRRSHRIPEKPGIHLGGF